MKRPWGEIEVSIELTLKDAIAGRTWTYINGVNVRPAEKALRIEKIKVTSARAAGQKIDTGSLDERFPMFRAMIEALGSTHGRFRFEEMKKAHERRRS